MQRLTSRHTYIHVRTTYGNVTYLVSLNNGTEYKKTFAYVSPMELCIFIPIDLVGKR